jgi:hypothetical protein
VPELLWKIGDARVERRSQRGPIWFARRLYDQSVWRQIKDVASRRPLTHCPGAVDQHAIGAPA